MTKKRFQGPAGKADLATLFAEQSLLFDTSLAATLADAAEVEDYVTAQPVYHEGEKTRRVIWFLLGGSVRIEKGLKPIATLARGQFFGEFPLLDATAPYAVSITAIENTCIARVPWDTFHALTAKHPLLWRNMAAELARRLRDAPAAAGATKPDDWADIGKWFVKKVLLGLFPRSPGLLFIACLSYALIGAAAFLWIKAPEAWRCGVLAGTPVAASAPASAASRP